MFESFNGALNHRLMNNRQTIQYERAQRFCQALIRKIETLVYRDTSNYHFSIRVYIGDDVARLFINGEQRSVLGISNLLGTAEEKFGTLLYILNNDGFIDFSAKETTRCNEDILCLGFDI